jgi:alkanesulfonate monooxygenase SsuD/methylene tetrahydromethanopterin reductase-like flavin-dependent oxidoreductase (luciferase family)
MLFCCFNPMPWPHLAARPPTWPFPNREFAPALAFEYYRTYIDQLVYAEECGFDWLAVGEDHMTAYSLTPNPYLVLSALCYRTSRARLAVLGSPLPLLNPLRVAEEAAMLDVMSNGRLLVGFIRGVPQNYAAYNVDPNESRDRFEEATALILRAWTDRDIFEWAGHFYHYPKVSLWPVPLQKPHPPIIYSANSVASARFAAKRRAAIGAIHLYTRDALEMVRAAIDAYRQQAASDGWRPPPQHFLVGLQTCIARDDEEARRLLGPALAYQYGVLSGTYDAEKRAIAASKPGYGTSPVEENPPDLDERLERGLVLCGSPQTVVEQIRSLVDVLGVGVVSMHFQVGNISDGTVRTGLRLFREHVLPRFR